MNNDGDAILIILISFRGKARLALLSKRKQKYQNSSIHRKVKVATSTILVFL
jgi:hypothetical protein